MKNKIVLITLMILSNIIVIAQTNYILNPSFEGTIGQGLMPSNWSSTGSESTPDTQPYDVRLQPSDGNSYIGLVMRGGVDKVPKKEEIYTKLSKPLLKNCSYLLSIDLSIAPYIYDVIREISVYYDDPPRLKLSGGMSDDLFNDVFAISDYVTDTVWNKYTFIFSPQIDTCKYIKLEVCFDLDKASYLLLDNIEIVDNVGEYVVCAGQQDVVYKLPSNYCKTGNSWSYTGQGAAIKSIDSGVEIDFDETATSGKLILSNINCESNAKNIEYPIEIVNNINERANISGENIVCPGQKDISYSASIIQGATSYEWEYNGYGASIIGKSDSIKVNFTNDATSGELFVRAINKCSNGPKSVKFPITVDRIPSGIGVILGDTIVCDNQNQVTYIVPKIDNATNYIWNYSGTGMIINGHSNKVSVDYTSGATNGNLTVSAANACGEGVPSLSLPISILPYPSVAKEIEGEEIVCANQNSVEYNTASVENATSYIWEFDGAGATIIGDSNNIAINFSEFATSGNLIVYGKNVCGMGTSSLEFPIKVNPFPEEAGNISGINEICYNQKEVTFSVEPINEAYSYNWEYSGSGISIIGSSNKVTINFSQYAKDGYLTVSGYNECGAGPKSIEFPISLFSCNQSEFGINIPNSFTPNGDGINDSFVIKGLIENSKLLIIDAYGTTVYKSDNYKNDWKGNSIDGGILNTNTYWYILTLSNTTTTFKGYVYLKR